VDVFLLRRYAARPGSFAAKFHCARWWRLDECSSEAIVTPYYERPKLALSDLCNDSLAQRYLAADARQVKPLAQMRAT
jgi:hypothetical protein